MNTEAIWHVVLDDMAFWAPTLLITGVGAAIGAVTGLILRRRNGSARKAFLVGWISGATLTFSAWRFVPRESLPLLFYDSDYELVGTGFWAMARFFAEQYVPAMAIGAFGALVVASLTAIFCRVTPQQKATEEPIRKYGFRLRTLLLGHAALAVLLAGWIAYHRDDIFVYGERISRQSELENVNARWRPFGFRVQRMDEEGHVTMLSVDSSGLPITNASLDVLAKQQRLENLNLFDANITDAQLFRVADLHQLKQLALNGRAVTDNGIAAISKLPKLEMLQLEASKLTPEVSRHIARISTLKYLYLTGVPIDDSGLAELTALKNMERVIWKGSSISDDGAQQFRKWERLTCINIDSVQIGDDTLKHLKDMPQLEELYLPGTSIGDEGATHLADMPQLIRLDLSGTRITDNALTYIGRLKELQSLTLSRTAITDNGTRQIEDLPKLEYLEILGTGVSPAGKRRLRQIYPGAVP